MPPSRAECAEHAQEADRLFELASLHQKIAQAYDQGVEDAHCQILKHVMVPGSCQHPKKTLSRETAHWNKLLEQEVIPTITDLYLGPNPYSEDIPF